MLFAFVHVPEKLVAVTVFVVGVYVKLLVTRLARLPDVPFTKVTFKGVEEPDVVTVTAFAFVALPEKLDAVIVADGAEIAVAFRSDISVPLPLIVAVFGAVRFLVDKVFVFGLKVRLLPTTSLERVALPTVLEPK